MVGATLCLLLLQNQFVWAGGLSLSFFPSPGNLPQTQSQNVLALEPNKPVEREINAGETHSYSLAIASGQYARFIAKQQGIGLVLKLFNASSEKLAEADLNGEAQGDEHLSVIAESAATYRLDIQASNKTAANGRYEIRLEELRPATEHDKTNVAAEKALLEGDQLRARNRAEALRNAIKKYEEAVAINRSLNDQRGEALALSRVANAHYLLGDLQKSLELFNQSLPLFTASGDKKLAAYVLNETGLIYSSMGDKGKALENYNQSLALKREVGDRWGEATTINNIGLLYSSQGYKPKALEYYTQSLQIRREVNDREGEAADLNNLGSVTNSIGKKDKALEFYDQALRIMRAIGDKRSEAVTLSNLGVINGQLGDPDKAIFYWNQSLQIRQETGDKQGEAITLNNIGNFYSFTGDKQKALEYYTKSLEMRRVIPDRRGEAVMLQNIGSIYSSTGDKQKGFEYYNQALALTRAVGDRKGEAILLGVIGRTYQASGDTEKSLDYFNQSLAISRSITDQRSEAGALFAIAQVERGKGNLSGARKNIEAAIEIIDDLRSSIEAPDIRTTFFATVKGYYDFYIDLLMRLHQQDASGNYQAQAFQVSERARARMLMESLIEAGAKIRQGVDSAVLDRERELQKQLSANADRFTRLLGGKYTEEQLVSAKNEIDALRRQVQQVRTQIRVSSPRYAALTQPTPLTLTEIQKQVVDANTLLLEYSLGEERSFLWAVTASSIQSFQLPKRKEIEEAAKRVYELLTARNKRVEFEAKQEKQERIAKADTEFPKAAMALSQMILSPVAGQLANKKLLIVSDGALQYVPFAVLPAPSSPASLAADARTSSPGAATNQPSATSNYEPLIIAHEVVSIPSAATLALIRKELSGRKAAPKTMAILADPVFDTNDARVKSEIAKKSSAKQPELVAQRRGLDEFSYEEVLKATRDVELVDNALQLPRLPGTRREAEAIIGLVARPNLRAALDFAANRETATSEELSRYRYIHFATHGVLNSQYPEFSGVVFSLVDEEGNRQNGFLRGHEIYNLQFPAELVVLSGCQTGLGKDIRGEGLVGLTRSFMYAGAARVMVSLWAVNDESTAKLMTQFYRDLLGTKPMSPAAALRAAQLSMWKDKQFNAPYYWAAFTLQGEPN
jgi:CHAT domain-containing protein/predicted negative regulator of RcsB-dependent stress response